MATRAPSSARSRLDTVLVERGLAPTRAKAQALILAGRVFSGHTRLEKPGTRVRSDLAIEVTAGPQFVSRAGGKLSAALDEFDVRVDGVDAIDVGASTGGFTDALLQRGAKRVVALDVGRGQLDWTLRNDPRVHVIEGVNARYLDPSILPFRPVLAVIDVSFISLDKILPPVAACLPGDATIVALVKPQFEVGRGKVGRGGIVRDSGLHREVLERACAFSRDHGWHVRGVAPSRVRGAEGNLEFFLYLALARPDACRDETADAIARAIAGGPEIARGNEEI